jgi:TolB-like protein/Tfp pilus assembly protein PilF
MQVLVCLIEHAGDPVTKEELFQAVWPNTFVSDDVLKRSISDLRQVFEDDSREPRFIETIPKRGYRLVASVERANGAGIVANANPTEVEHASGDSRRGLRIGIVLGLSALVLFIALLGAGPTKVWRRLLGQTDVPQIRSIAVLPLKNLSGDPGQEYFAEGMTEELITDLSQVSALKVISRTSSEMYQNKQEPLPQIARELNVDAIVEGSVQRSDGQVRITAQLIYAPDDKNIWAHTYVRDSQSALTLQGELAAAIADQVERTLSPPHTVTRRVNTRATNPDAYDLYLKGRYYWNQRTEAGFWKGIESFRQAAEKDPNYAQAYAGLADCYILLGPNDVLPAKEVYPLAKTAALKALQLDDTLAEAHASLGFVMLLYDWNPVQAEKEFRRAIGLNPNYPTAHHWYAYDLAAMKRADEAVAEIRRALELDPLSPIINTDVGQILFLVRRPDEAIVQCQKTIGLDAQFSQIYWYLGLLYEQEGMFDQAFEAFMKAPPGFSGSPPDASIRAAYRASGIKGYWRERLSLLERQSKEHYVSPFTFAVSYARMGEADKALENLSKALDERYPSMVFLRIEPVFDSLRSDPRFEGLMQQVAQAAK